jgi:hypothetical protein
VKRIVGAVLFGLGVLLLVVAVGLPLYVAPAVSQLPYDLEKSTSVAESDTAQFLQVKSGVASINTAKLRSTTWVVPQADVTHEKMTGDLEGEAVVWDVSGRTVRTDTGEMISAYSAELALDRKSGEAADWSEEFLEDGNASPPNFQGLTYKFPFGTEKKEYQFYDRDLRRALPVQFKEVDRRRGVEVYRFEQVIPEQQLTIDPTSMAVLLATFAPGATSGQVIYTNTRTWWIEPTTGAYVDVRDQPHKELVPDTGPRTVLLDADFSYDEATGVASAERAERNAARINLVTTWGPLGLALIGLGGIVAGSLLVLRGGGRRPRHRGTDELPSRGGGRDDGPLTDVLPPPSRNWASDTTTMPGRRPPSGSSASP